MPSAWALPPTTMAQRTRQRRSAPGPEAIVKLPSSAPLDGLRVSVLPWSMQKALGILGGATAAGTLAWFSGPRRWRAATGGLTRKMTETAARSEGRVRLASLSSTPELVRRYFRVALREGGPLIRTARIVQMGEFRSKETEDTEAGWQSFEARQRVQHQPTRLGVGRANQSHTARQRVGP